MRRLSVAVGVALLLGLAAGLIPASPVAAVAVCFGEDATIEGSGTISGTPEDDVIVGSSGADVIKGNGGDDIICAGGGDDTVNGNSGNDLIFGEAGSDTLAGDAGDDVLVGDADSAAVSEDAGLIVGWQGYLPGFGDCANAQPGFGTDRLTGGSGDDRLFDVCGNNTADGGQGSDFLDVSGTAKGGSGDDVAVWAYDGLYDNGSYRGLADGGSGSETYVYVHGGIANGGSGNDGVWAEHTGSAANGGSGSDTLADYSDDPFSDPFHDDTSEVTLNGGSGWDSCYDTGGDDELVRCDVVL
jgi:hypothetical protein